ncbi:OsmC family protein [Nocardioides perillae]|uniref:Organic hydroperoxide reductase OsmC/OhrA n=1 Tax=Nocardioides perillae TaxID=1119534 RepID=A0A7Y9URD7_9ACTN|nr:organic hydroperoxide reductase OsmC/OhrA [Nocardioides perillae]
MEHGYALSVTWTGDRGEGTRDYRGYGRDHVVRAEPVRGQAPPDLLGSADRTFHGDPARWNPEQLLLAALAQCHLLSYLHVCVDAGVVVTAYVDRAVGTVRTDRDGGGQFTEVVLRPEVVVADASMLDAAAAAHTRAHALCFIARSVAFPVRHEPVVRVGRALPPS